MPASVVNGWSLSLLFSGYKRCLFHSIKEHLNLYSYLSWNVWGERKTQFELAKWSWNLICMGCSVCTETSFTGDPSSLPRAAPAHRKCVLLSMIPASAVIWEKLSSESIISHALVALKKPQLPKRGDRHWQICAVFLLKTVSLCECSK